MIFNGYLAAALDPAALLFAEESPLVTEIGG